MKRERMVDCTGEGCYLNIEVTTGAKASSIGTRDEWRGSLRVDVAAKPVEGEANAELIRFFESAFPEARGRIALAKGGKSRSKRIFIPLEKGLILSRLGLKDDD